MKSHNLLCRVSVATTLLLVAVSARAVTTEKRTLPNKKASYLVVLPDKYDPRKTYDLIVPLHGAGDSAANFAQVWSPIVTRRGNTILAVPQGSQGQGSAFTWSSTDVELIAAVVQDVFKNYSVSPKRVLLTGFSAGCTMGFIVISQKPDLFACFGGIAGVWPDQLPPKELQKAAGKVAVYYAVGKRDGNNAGVFTPMVDLMKKQGFNLKAEEPNCGHTLRAEEVKNMLAFFDSLAKENDNTKLAEPPK